MTQRLLCWLFSIVYRRWLYDDYYGPPTRLKVLKVKGWRTARVCRVTPTGRHSDVRTITPCFWIFW